MYFEKTDKGYILRVRLTPNSSSCRVAGLIYNQNNEAYLKINVVAIPEKGKANKDLINFLARKLKTAKSDLQIISGESDRWKKIFITQTEPDIITNLQLLAEN